MGKHIKAEALFKKAIAKHNHLMKYEKIATTDELIIYLQELISDYSTILKLVPKEKNTRNNRGLAKSNLAELYVSLGRDEEAIDKFDSAVGDFNMVLSHNPSYPKSYRNKASANSSISKLYEQKGEDISTIEYLGYANNDYLKLLNYNSQDIDALDRLSKNMDKIANIYQRSGNYHKALSFYQKSIDYAQKILTIDPNDIDSLSNIPSSKSDMARVYFLLGQNRESIELYNQSIDEFLVFLSKYPTEIISLNSIALAYTELANIYRYEIVKEQDESFVEKAKNLYMESAKYYKKALKIDNKDIPTFVNQALNYSELGVIYIYMKENLKAIEVFEKSSNILYEALEIDDSYTEIMNNINLNRLNLAEAYKRDGKISKSLEILENSLELSGNKNGANIKSEIGRLYLDKGVKDKAIEFFDNALNDYLVALESNPNSLMILKNISTLFENILKLSTSSHYVDRAIWCNQKIIEIYDNYFIDIGFEEDSFSLTQKMSTALERLLDVYIKSGKKADHNVVEAIERVKAKRLKQLMVSNLFEDIDSWFDEQERVELEQIKMKLDSIKREIKKESFTIFDSEKRSRLYEEFQDYSQQLYKLLSLDMEEELNIYEKIDSQSVVIYPIECSNRVITVSVRVVKNSLEVKIYQQNIKSNIKFSDYLLFIKYIGNLFNKESIISRKSLRQVENIGIDKKIKNYIFEKMGTEFSALKIEEDEFFEEYRYEIIQIALSHIEKSIVKSIPKGVKKILFSPFGALNLLPLHAMPLKRGYLIERYEIGYIPSLSILNYSEIDSNQIDKNLFVSISKDGFDSESEKCINIVGGEHFIDIKAKDFKEHIDKKSFNIIHLSTHGHADIGNPLNSYIEFYKSNLSLFDIYSLTLDTNLVMMSACETYMSKLKGADEVLAFERAFLIAGVRNIITTFLSVDANRAEDLMELFYDKFDKNSISKTFQQACIEDIENGSMEWSLFRFTGV